MKGIITVGLGAVLCTGCAQYEQRDANDDSIICSTRALGAFTGHGGEALQSLQMVGCTNPVQTVEDAAEPYVYVDFVDGSKIRLAWDLKKTGEEQGSLKHQCRRLKQAMDAGVVTGAVIWTALEYGATSRIYAEEKNGWNIHEASECIRRGDKGMANKDELEAISWYAEAGKRACGMGSVKEQVARHALSVATADPSPDMIDYAVCHTACTMRLTGRLAKINDRLLERYATKPRFTIADAPKMSHEECQHFACELAAIGNCEGIAYLLDRGLIDANDTTGGGVLHHAAVAGNVAMVKWLICVCGAEPLKRDKTGLTPEDWVNAEIRASKHDHSGGLDAVQDYLKVFANQQ